MHADTAPLTRRLGVFGYGVLSYAVFVASFLYLIGFIGNLYVPTAIDGVPRIGVIQALAADLSLLLVFALQHSLMARPRFKRWARRIVPAAAERSTYVLCSSLALILLYAGWQPLGGAVWHLDSATGQALAWSLFAAGWLLILLSTFLINHFDLFGLRQVWLYLWARPYTPVRFATPWLYQQVRHPLYAGWLIVFWATPTMSVTHLLFALALTAYILVAVRFEERDLLAEHGDAYRRYRAKVPMLIPAFQGVRVNPPARPQPAN